MMRNALKCFVVVTLASVLSIACESVPADNPYDPEAPESVQARGKLIGQILNGDGQVAEGVVVSLDGTSLTATTDADGHFTLTEVPKGVHALVARLDCHRPHLVTGLAFEIGMERTLPPFALTKALGAVRGRVEVQGPAPIAFTEVTVEAGAARGRPDAAGAFTLFGVPACAQQSVLATAPGYVPAVSAGVDVVEGETVELSAPLVLTARPGYLKGKLRRAVDDPAPVEGLAVQAVSTGGNAVDGVTDAQGGFLLTVPAGPLALIVSVPGYVTLRQSVDVPAAAAEADAFDLGELRLQYAHASISGTVVLDDGASPEGVVVALAEGPTVDSRLTGPDGAFSFPLVRTSATPYRLVGRKFGYEAPPGAPVEVLVQEDTPVADVQVPLRVRTGVLCGRVTFPLDGQLPPALPPIDDCPMPTADNPVRPEASVRLTTTGMPPAEVHSDGYFRLEPRAGTHTVEVAATGFIRETRFNIFVGDDPAVPTVLDDISLLHARGGLSGTVDLADCPQGDTLVTIVATAPSGAESALVNVPGRATDPDCDDVTTFDFPAIRVGEYTVSVRSTDYLSASLPATVLEAQRTALDPVVLDINPGTVETVVNPEGISLVDEATPCDAVPLPLGLAGVEVGLDGGGPSGSPDCHGRVTLTDVRAGVYTLRVLGNETYDEVVVPTVTVLPGRATDLGRFALPFARGTVTGVVTTDDGPAVNAQVVLEGPESGVALTSDEGAFQFFDIRAETYNLRVLYDGYEPGAARFVVRRAQTTNVPPIVLALNPGLVRGRVIAEGGDGVGFQVSVSGRENAQTLTLPEDGPRLPGTFELPGLRAGSYSLLVSDGPKFRTRSLPGLQVVPGEALDIGRIDIDRAAGRVSFSVTLEDQARLSADAVANIMAQTTVSLEPNDAADPFLPRYTASPAADGRVEFSAVWVGTYRMRIQHVDYASPDETPVLVRADNDNVTLDEAVLLPIRPGTISGNVLLEDGRSALGTLVSISDPAVTVQADADGDFQVVHPSLKARVYTVTIRRDGYLDEARSVTVRAGEDTPIGQVQLSLERGTLSGTVATADNTSPVGAFVALAGLPEGLVRIESADGAFELRNMPAGDYTLRVSLDAYLTSERQVSIDQEVPVATGRIVLAVDAGRFTGTVLSETGGAVVGATVSTGNASVQTGAGGAFSLAGLKAGGYTVTITAANHQTLVLDARTINAGLATSLGDQVLLRARGDLAGTVDLADGESPAGVVVTASSAGEVVQSVVADASGDYAFTDLIVGVYTLSAERADYAAESESVTVVVDGLVEVPPMTLAINPGGLRGRIVLTDGDDDDLRQAVVRVEPTGNTAVPAADGTFTLGGLKAGIYTLSVTLPDYHDFEAQGYRVEGGATNAIEDIELIDRKDPPTPTVALNGRFEPLPGFPQAPPVLVGGTVDAVVTFPAGGDAGADANFDPDSGLGFWQVRSSFDLSWRDHDDPDDFVFDGLPGGVNVVQVRAVDSNNNVGTEGELIVFIDDDDGPGKPNLGAPLDKCFTQQVCNDAPTGLNSVDPAVQPCTCVINADTINVPILPMGEPERYFGCHYVAVSPPYGQACVADRDCAGGGDCEDRVCNNDAARSCAVDGDCRNGGQCGPGQCGVSPDFDPENDETYDVDGGECYPFGTQYVSVFPEEGSKQLVCLKAFDQARQPSPSSCVEVDEDSTDPIAPDLLPTDTEVRGESVQVGLWNPNDTPLDANFVFFEKKSDKNNGVWVRARHTVNGQLVDESTSFSFSLLPGETNELAVRAVDRAGNRSEPATVYLHENSVRYVWEGPEGVGLSVDKAGSRTVWARPVGCDPRGQARTCDFEILMLDDASRSDEPVVGTTATACTQRCLANTPRAPLVQFLPNGFVYSEYIAAAAPANDATRLIYWDYGTDLQPFTADDNGGQPIDAEDAISAAVPGRGHLRFTASEALFAALRNVSDADAGTPGDQPGFVVEAGLLIGSGAGGSGPLQPEHNVNTFSLGAGAYAPTYLSTHGNAALSGYPDQAPRVMARIGEAHMMNRNLTDTVRLPSGFVLPNVKYAVLLADSIFMVVEHGAVNARIRSVWWPKGLNLYSVDPVSTCVGVNLTAEQGCVFGQTLQSPRTLDNLIQISCTAMDNGVCGEVREVAVDSSILVATVTAPQANGEPIDRLLMFRNSNEGPQSLLNRFGTLSSPRVSLDSMVVIDHSTGIARPVFVDPTDQKWFDLRGRSSEDRNHPRAATDWVVFSRVTPTGAVAPQSPNAPRLFVVPAQAEGVIEARMIESSAEAYFDAAMWANGRGYNAEGSLIAWVERITAPAGQTRARLRVIDTAQTCAAQNMATCVDACTASGNCVSFRIVHSQDVNTSATVSAWDVAMGGANVVFHARVGQGAGVVHVRLVDLRVIANAGDDVTSTSADLGYGVSPFHCRAMAVSETRISCLWADTLANGNRLRITTRVRANAVTAWSNAANITSTTAATTLVDDPDAVGGPTYLTSAYNVEDLYLIDNFNLVFEIEDAGVRRIYRLNSEGDQVFGDNPLTNNGPLDDESLNDRLRLLYARFGENLGRMEANLPNYVVFADSGRTLQPEIFRVRVRDGRFDRLSTDDALQVQPTVSTRGVMWVDHRYTTTANGQYLFPPALTFRGLP